MSGAVRQAIGRTSGQTPLGGCGVSAKKVKQDKHCIHMDTCD